MTGRNLRPAILLSAGRHDKNITMPPAAVKTIRDQIFWQYAKLIAKSAGLSNARAFQMSRFTKLRDGEIVWSSTIREWLHEHENPDSCIYCGAQGGPLTTEHILPRCCGGPDIPDNAIRVCRSCNSEKGGRRLYEWKGLAEKDAIPRIAEGKYLKLLYDLHEQRGTLNVDKKDLGRLMCPACDLRGRCEAEGTVEKMSVFCLEGGFHAK